MVRDLLFDEFLLFILLWLCVTWYGRWHRSQSVPCQSTSTLAKSSQKRSQHQRPFPGLIHKPPCEACERLAEPSHPTSSAPPPQLTSMRGRRREVITQHHFCPHPSCDYYGWVGLNNIRANGHPGSSPWRQLQCVMCHTSFQETHGTPLHGKRVPPERFVWAVGALAEGLGIRAVARVFEVGPNTVLHWSMEAADHAAASSQYFLHDLQVTQVQLDELFALLSAVQAGEVSEGKAMTHLSRSPHWVWVAIDPVNKLLLALDVGDRTLAMAQRVVHQVVQVLAPGCVPLFLTDGFKEYLTALLAHYGHWVQPSRRRAQGPAPKPRWMPLPQLLYAQVVKRYRRRRLVSIRHRVVFGTLAGVHRVLAATGWQINTAFIERANLTIRQHVAAVGRRVITLCKGEDGLRQQLIVFQTYHNFCLPHAALRQPLPQSLPTNGTGSAKRWRPCTPAMATGLTDHVCSMREVLLFRVPPWPQPQAL
jgi:IS1 family transposase/transposase-like protein